MATTINEFLLVPESLADVMTQADKASYMMNAVRGALLAPENKKSAPHFNITELAALCEADRSQIVYRSSKGDLPAGTINTSGNRRSFTLEESMPWIREFRAPKLRPDGAHAVCISVANFKGGVGKTTTTMTLAQGLALKGHKVLVLDCDPQGSLTTLFGILPDTEVDETQTILPARQMREDDFEFWNVLNQALGDVRDQYDVIIIDTPPALSYVTINALMASDGILMPLPPNALDAASAAQFWRLFSDLAGQLVEQRGVTKNFDFVCVLLTRVDSQDSTTATIRDWINKTYEGKVLPAEIPKTTVASSSSAEFGTVYDVGKYEGNQKTYKRARDAYERVAELMEEVIRATWRRQLSNQG